MTEKPRIFISYAHKDSSEIAQRLALALEPYCSEVFWDQKLRAGDWKHQLEQRIMSHEFFVVIMSPEQSQSELCQWELDLARTRLSARDKSKHFEIVPIKVFCTYRDDHLEKLQYADFTGEFESGFASLTQLIFGRRHYSWECLTSASPREIFAAIKKGAVPAPVIRDTCEWLIMSKVWGQISSWVSKDSHSFIFVGNPQTPEDVLIQVKKLIPQMAERQDAASIVKLQKAWEVVSNYLECDANLTSSNYQAACQSALALIADVYNFLREEAAARLDAIEIVDVDTNYALDVASALRKHLKVYARKARI